jgi:hypothetical protein
MANSILSQLSQQRFAAAFVTQAAAVIASLGTLAGSAGAAPGDLPFGGAGRCRRQ